MTQKKNHLTGPFSIMPVGSSSIIYDNDIKGDLDIDDFLPCTNNNVSTLLPVKNSSNRQQLIHQSQ